MSEESQLSFNEIHESLSNTSVDLHYIFWNVSREEQVRRPNLDEWSPLEILVHLRQVGEVYAQRVNRIVNNEDPATVPNLADFDEKKQMGRVNLEDETVKHNIGQFMQARSSLLNAISFLEEGKWDDLKCLHKVHGEITLRQLLIPLVIRERNHLDKLKLILDKTT